MNTPRLVFFNMTIVKASRATLLRGDAMSRGSGVLPLLRAHVTGSSRHETTERGATEVTTPRGHASSYTEASRGGDVTGRQFIVSPSLWRLRVRALRSLFII